MKAQVIVIGGGPSGASLAALLADAGISTVLLEQEELPRSKPCGGAVTPKSIDILSRMTDPAAVPVERAVRKFTFRYADADHPVTHHGTDDEVLLVSRRTFDAHLVQMAARKGAAVHSGVPVHDVHIDHTGVRVRTAMGDATGTYVVGADGAVGTTAHSLRLPRAPLAPALRCRVPIEVYRGPLDTCLLDYGDIRGGYSWVFPKDDHLNVGAGFFARNRIPLHQHLASYLRRLDIDPDLAHDLRGHPIPTGPRDTIAGQRFLLVGDAAHLCDPFTGEGISAALLSAELAAAELMRAWDTGKTDLSSYEQRIWERLGTELRMASGISRIFARFPHFIHRLVATDESIMSQFFAVVAGRCGYTGIHRQLLKRIPIFSGDGGGPHNPHTMRRGNQS